jgi:DNA protecting protein DprA
MNLGSGLPAEAYAVALASLPGAGPGWLAGLLSRHGPQEAWRSVLVGEAMPPRPARTGRGPAEAPGDAGQLGVAGAGYLEVARRYDVGAAWRRCTGAGVRVTWPGAKGYPSSLEKLRGRPGVLFWVGDISWVERCPVVALVGTRRCSPEGAEVAYEIASDLAAAGVCVVSGLALGIDGAAHAGALAGLEAARTGKGAATVGVAASGVDVVYPRQHAALWRRVASTGAIISETPPGVPAQPWRFPARNRVIAGLAQMVVVVECHLAGGSWHTVDAALRSGVEVGAVPGSVRSPASDGTNMMIRDGATPVRSARDVLDALGLSASTTGAQEAPSPMGPGGKGTRVQARPGNWGAEAGPGGRLGASRYPSAAPPEQPSGGAGCQVGDAGQPPGQLSAQQELAGNAAARTPSGSVAGARRGEVGPVEQRVLDAIGLRPVCLEEVVERSGLPVGAVAVALARLEEVGAVLSEGGWWWLASPRR